MPFLFSSININNKRQYTFVPPFIIKLLVEELCKIICGDLCTLKSIAVHPVAVLFNYDGLNACSLSSLEDLLPRQVTLTDLTDLAVPIVYLLILKVEDIYSSLQSLNGGSDVGSSVLYPIGVQTEGGIFGIKTVYKEIKVGLINLSSEEYTLTRGERIAQMVIMPVAHANFTVTDELDKTQRGSGGFGSTGAY